MAVNIVFLAALVLAAPALAERLIFNDDFNFIDNSKWRHQISPWRGGNQEFQFYRDDRRNSYVRNGILYIKPTLTADEFGENTLQKGSLTFNGCNFEPCVSKAGSDIVLPVLSARLDTHGKFSFKYGRVEIRARLPRGDWLWPAIWFMPEYDRYGGWPRSGEIDLTESRGNANLKDPQGNYRGLQTFATTLHFGPNPQNDKHRLPHVDKFMGSSQTLADDFHVYTLDWTPQGMRFLLDGKQYHEVKRPQGGFWKYGGFSGDNIWKNGTDMAPFDQEFYIILNLAVGGAYFNDEYRNSPYSRPWGSLSGQPMREFWAKKSQWYSTWQGEKSALQIDYVRVYQN